MENLLVILIVSLAGIYVIRIFHRSVKKGGDCHGCSSCDVGDACQELPDKKLGD